MSAHRDLVNAQQALNEAVEKWVTAKRSTVRYPDERERSDELLDHAWGEFAPLRNNLDAPGGAAPRATSINAAHANLPAKESLRRNIVMCVVAQHAQFGTGMTVADLKGRLRKEHSSVSSAINALMMRGWLKDSGETRLTQHHEPAIVWVPTEMAITKCRELALEVNDGS